MPPVGQSARAAVAAAAGAAGVAAGRKNVQSPRPALQRHVKPADGIIMAQVLGAQFQRKFGDFRLI
ncbi:hypothetical protein CAEBREN_23453 [Caenorhabditis brenneri]|uniref:Uncharacterized protein n=1 Tax=Caenorhabditis brenneri TaxID=135651 RepID=G0P437_CAEBE|nr:hypothetical protein CAEBREN_23453 [Caenorhabditis brenneri]